MMNGMDTLNSISSFDSTFDCEESHSGINLNNAFLMSTDEEILSYSDNEIFYDTYETFSPLRNNETETDMSIENNRDRSSDFSDLFEYTDSTSLFSLPYTNNYFNHENNKNTIDSMKNKNNLQNEKSINIEEDETKRIPLKVLLKRMFDEILGKHTKSTINLNTVHSNESSTSKSSLNSNLLINKLNNTFEINNNDPLDQMQKPIDIVITPVENTQNSDQVNISFPHNRSIPFCNGSFPKKLVTILENSNESSSNSHLQNSSDWSGRCIGKLNFPYKKLEKRYYVDDKIFTTSDINNSETSTSSSISTDISILNMEIFQKANNL